MLVLVAAGMAVMTSRAGALVAVGMATAVVAVGGVAVVRGRIWGPDEKGHCNPPHLRAVSVHGQRLCSLIRYRELPKKRNLFTGPRGSPAPIFCRPSHLVAIREWLPGKSVPVSPLAARKMVREVTAAAAAVL